MKKVMFCLAVAGMFAFASCGNGEATEETVDSTAIEVVEEQVVEEQVVVDSTVEAVADEAAAATTEQAQ